MEEKFRDGGARSHNLPLRRGMLYPIELRLDHNLLYHVFYRTKTYST